MRSLTSNTHSTNPDSRNSLHNTFYQYQISSYWPNEAGAPGPFASSLGFDGGSLALSDSEVGRSDFYMARSSIFDIGLSHCMSATGSIDI